MMSINRLTYALKTSAQFIIVATISCNTFSQDILPPYHNNFDTIPNDTLGWNHYAISGVDDWQIGTPSDTYLNLPYSSPNAWVTNLNQNFQANSNRALETPYFNLSNTTENYAFVFRHKTHSSGSIANYYVEYTTDHGATWLLLNNVSAQKKNWQSTTGFLANSYTNFTESAINLSFIQGSDSVKFRFRCNSGIATGEGWLIDQFSIAEPYYNLTPQIGTPIVGKNKFFPDFTVESSLTIVNQFTNSLTFSSNFYLSQDNFIDGGDYYLGQINNTENVSINNWDYTFNMPPNLNAGTYYVLYDVDVTDAVTEGSETDNISYTLLYIDSIFASPFKDNFDSTFVYWNNSPNTIVTSWSHGEPNSWQGEKAHSGNYAWFTNANIPSSNNLESPYLDLTSSINTSMCFWYRTSKNNPDLTVKVPLYNQSSVDIPYYPSWVGYYEFVDEVRRPGWDCYCIDLTNYDGEISTKIMITGVGSNSPPLGRSVIDDVYVGPAKPDARIEGESILRFTPSNVLSDTLYYTSFNAGLNALISTTTEFYWSLDSILDVSDIFLGTNIEPAIIDTSFVENYFAYTKPTLVEGTYFIFYKSDANFEADEMWEENNIGYFKINQNTTQNLPYFNDFETSVTGWTHTATLGTDSWSLGDPEGVYLDTVFSGVNAFFSNIDGNPTYNSRMHLMTPIFDLTQLNQPVLEFDLLYKHVGTANYSAANIMYSIDGGASWIMLDTSQADFSYKRMYYRFEYSAGGGVDLNYTNPPVYILYGLSQLSFLQSTSYQGRNYDNTTHHVIDLNKIKNSKNVQFMFVYSNINTETEGILIDNFKITERETDLLNPSNKNLMSDPGDFRIKQNIQIKNNANFLSSSFSVNFYCSEDSLLTGSDILLGSMPFPQIKPYETRPIIIDFLAPPNFEIYNYLLLEIDPDNLTIESNEINNVSYLELSMDTASSYEYPVLFDFEQSEIDGWAWYMAAGSSGHRFRHISVVEDPSYHESGLFFLDKPDPVYSISSYPIHYLESPPFDFTNKTNIDLTFDFTCGGAIGTNSMGGNFQYTTDGGAIWQTLVSGSNYDSNPFNWYDNFGNNVSSLSNEPGWLLWYDWNTAQYDLSFLSGQDSVRFRFQIRSNHIASSTSGYGLKLDNFKIESSYLKMLPPINICQGEEVLIFGELHNTSGIYYDPITNYVGSDTVYAQELIVALNSVNYTNVELCKDDSYTFLDGFTLDSITQDVVHTSSLPCVNCCDSIVHEFVQIIDISTNVILNLGTLYSTHNGANYQWLLCENGYTEILDANSQSYTAYDLGEYAVIIEFSGCIDTSECYNIHSLETSEQTNSVLKIYPNPSAGFFTISNQESSYFECKLIATTGQEIWTKTLLPNETIVSEVQLQSGMYFIMCISENENRLFKLLITQ